jgi:hypothetical protein
MVMSFSFHQSTEYLEVYSHADYKRFKRYAGYAALWDWLAVWLALKGKYESRSSQGDQYIQTDCNAFNKYETELKRAPVS